MAVITSAGCLMAGHVGKDASALAASEKPLWGDLTLFEPPESGFEKAGEIPEYSLSEAGLSVKSYLDRVSAHTLMAVGLALGGRCDPDMGLSFATRWGPVSSMKLFFEKVKQNPRFAPPLPFSHSYANSPASVAAIEFGMHGWHCVFSDGDASGIDALAAAADEADRTGGVIVAAGAEALSPELYAYYHAAGLAGEPSEEAPEAFVPAEAAAAFVVEPSGEGRRIRTLPGTPARGLPTPLPERIITDAYTHRRMKWFEQIAGGGRGMEHIGMKAGGTGAVGGLLAVATALLRPEAALVLAGDEENARMMLVEAA